MTGYDKNSDRALADIDFNRACYAVPWALWPGPAGDLWLNPGYKASAEPHGTYRMRVERRNDGYHVWPVPEGIQRSDEGPWPSRAGDALQPLIPAIAEAGQYEMDYREWVAQRDRAIDAEAATLAHVGITGPDDLCAKYGWLCHLYETGELPRPGEFGLLTSDDARAFADKVLVIMHGGPWRDGEEGVPE